MKLLPKISVAGHSYIVMSEYRHKKTQELSGGNTLIWALLKRQQE